MSQSVTKLGNSVLKRLFDQDSYPANSGTNERDVTVEESSIDLTKMIDEKWHEQKLNARCRIYIRAWSMSAGVHTAVRYTSKYAVLDALQELVYVMGRERMSHVVISAYRYDDKSVEVHHAIFALSPCDIDRIYQRQPDQLD